MIMAVQQLILRIAEHTLKRISVSTDRPWTNKCQARDLEESLPYTATRYYN